MEWTEKRKGLWVTRGFAIHSFTDSFRTKFHLFYDDEVGNGDGIASFKVLGDAQDHAENMVSPTAIATRLEHSIEGLAKVARRLCRDHKLSGGDGPLAEAYHAVLTAKLEIEQYLDKGVGHE